MATTVANQSLAKLQNALNTKFPSRKVNEVVFCFNKLMKEARLDHWGESITDAGKFVEAVLKCFHYLRTGDELDIIKVDEEVRQLEQTTSLSDFERLTIPRTLRLIYEFRNRRGAAHNSSFDPIKTDCIVVVALSKWVMEELARLYLTNDAVAAKMLVENLLVKDIPLVEEIDGDLLVLIPNLSARVQLEILLRKEHPKRFPIKDLAHWIHNHSIDNIRNTLRTMRGNNLAHVTEEGWRLTDTGINEAEMEIGKLHNGLFNTATVSKSRAKGARRGRK